MLMAVSILSPVSTHTLIPASFINWIVSATLSCNLSSIAVEPINSKSFSINSLTFAISSSLSTTLCRANVNFSFHYSYSSVSKYFYARSRVRRPSFAYASINSKVSSTYQLFYLFNLGSIIESAPLVSNIIFPSLSWIITLIRFLELVNSSMLSSLYCYS